MKRSNNKHFALTFSKFYILFIVLIITSIMIFPSLKNTSNSNMVTGLIILEENQKKMPILKI